jgi:protein ECT2
MILSVHQYGLFKFRTGKNSHPATPTASSRSRAAIFGLDAISRNLFNARPGSIKSELFGNSINGSYRRSRSKSAASRSSLYTTSTATTMTTMDSQLTRMTSRTNSTAATSVMSTDEDDTASSNRTPKARKLLKRNKPSHTSQSENELERTSSRLSVASESVPSSRSPSTDRELDYSDIDDADGRLVQHVEHNDSDWNLTMQLELARRNSRNQHEVSPLNIEQPWQDTIFEGMRYQMI